MFKGLVNWLNGVGETTGLGLYVHGVFFFILFFMILVLAVVADQLGAPAWVPISIVAGSGLTYVIACAINMN